MKNLLLPISLLLSCSLQSSDQPSNIVNAGSLQSSALESNDVSTQDSTTTLNTDTVDNCSDQVTTSSIDETPVDSTSTQDTSATPTSTLPCDADVNSMLSLLGAYQQKAALIQALQDALSADPVDQQIPDTTTIQSFSNLIALQNQQAALIQNVTDAVNTLQATLANWQTQSVATQAAVTQKATGKKEKKNQKATTRDIDFSQIPGIIKERDRERSANN